MMMFLLLVGVMLLLLGGVAGIVLFIIGLVKHKPSMWGSGIVLAVLTVLMFAGGIVALWSYLFVVVSSPQYAPIAWDPNAVRAAKDLDAAKSYFQECVGMTLPEGVSVIWRDKTTRLGKEGSPNADVYQYKLSVTPDFEEFLAGRFKKTQWSDVKDEFMIWMVTFGEEDYPPMPEEGRLKALPIYKFTQPDNPSASATFSTSVVLDPNSREAWIVGEGWHKQ
jgi:hypothetical protein